MYPEIDLGFIDVPTYWLLNITGVYVAYLLFKWNNKRHKEYELKRQDMLFFMLYIVMGGIVGSRLLFIVTYIPEMISNPSMIYDVIITGGSVFYGGAIGGFFGGLIYIKMYGLDPIKYFNLVSISIPLGHAIGRLGCFLAGCCYGHETDSIFGVVFPEGPAHLHESAPLHPTQLYESAFNLIIFAILMFFFYKWQKHKPYVFGSMYLMMYSVARFINEFFRGDEYRGVLVLSTSQWISIFVFCFGVFLLFAKPERLKWFRQTEPTSKFYREFLEREKLKEQEQENQKTL